MKEYFLIVITRIKNENMMLRSFIPYYFSQGVDKIFLLDDNSSEEFEDIVINNPNVKIISVPYKNRHPEWSSTLNVLTKELREKTEWVLTVDCDEFITTRKNSEKTIRQELIDNFSEVSCIKIPWVMFTRNERIENPKYVLLDTVWRWNHDLSHKHKYNSWKYRDRKGDIEVKCIWKPSHYCRLACHHPHGPTSENIISVDSIDKLPSSIHPHHGSHYCNLSEEKIKRAYFTCNHYYCVSEEHAKQKCTTDSISGYNTIKHKTFHHESNILENVLISDYPEIKDTLLKDKFEKIDINNILY